MPEGEHYEPTPEDYDKAEAAMTDEEKGMSEEREQHRISEQETPPMGGEEENIPEEKMYKEILLLREESSRDLIPQMNLNQWSMAEFYRHQQNDERMIRATQLAVEILDKRLSSIPEAGFLSMNDRGDFRVLYKSLTTLICAVHGKLAILYDEDHRDEWKKRGAAIEMAYCERDFEDKYGYHMIIPAWHTLVGSTPIYDPDLTQFDYPGKLSISRQMLDWYKELKSGQSK